MTHAVKVGIVGLGRWARTLTRAVQASENLRIVAAYGISPEERAEYQHELANQYGIRVTPDLQTMLADPHLEGAILTVPNEEHWPTAREVAQAGKHVYTEKPIATTLEDGLRIAALNCSAWPMHPLVGDEVDVGGLDDPIPVALDALIPEAVRETVREALVHVGDRHESRSERHRRIQRVEHCQSRAVRASHRTGAHHRDAHGRRETGHVLPRSGRQAGIGEADPIVSMRRLGSERTSLIVAA